MNEAKKNELYDRYENSTHLLGRLGTAAAILLLLAVPMAMGWVLNASPDWKAFGVGFAQALMSRMAVEGGRLFLLGAKPGVAEKAAANLAEQYPGLTVCGTHDGYFKEDGPVVEAIKAAGADVVFVCLGSPKQELWMAGHGPATGARLMVGLGGALDVFAGTVERAPEGFQKLGLEWLYRLAKEPKRAGRMAKLPLVLVYALGERLGGKRHEKG